MSVDHASRTVTSNTAFHYVCYRLSALGWHVEPSGPTPVNRTLTVRRQGFPAISLKVKAVNGRLAAGLGSGNLRLIHDYVVVVDLKGSPEPTSFVLCNAEVLERVNTNTKDGVVSFWLESGDYRQPQFENRWDKIGTVPGNG